MNPDNDRIRDFLGVTAWHKAGYTGKRVIAGSGESFVGVPFPNHPYLTAYVFHEIAPDAELLYLPAEGYENETFMSASIETMIERKVCTWFYSMQGVSDGYNMDGAFERVKDFCTMFNAAGNDGDDDFSHLINAKWIYGVGSVILMADGTVVPENISSLSEHVDFCAPANYWINGAYNTGTSLANPTLAGMVALINDMAMDKLGKPLSSEMMYQCLKDNAHDIYYEGKDTKTGWGYVTLPDPATFDIWRYAPLEIVMQIGSNKMTVNGAEQTLEQPPFITSANRTVAPVRAVFEAAGLTVSWDAATQTITAKR